MSAETRRTSGINPAIRQPSGDPKPLRGSTIRLQNVRMTQSLLRSGLHGAEPWIVTDGQRRAAAKLGGQVDDPQRNTPSTWRFENVPTRCEFSH
jgi:hypothetical protein